MPNNECRIHHKPMWEVIEYQDEDIQRTAFKCPLCAGYEALTQSQAREAVLREALVLMKDTYPYSPPCFGWEAQVEAHRAATKALKSTAAHAEAYIQRVRAEALEDAAERAIQTDYSLYSGPRQDAILRAAILNAPATNTMKGDGDE